jgi:hypothetical protein
MQHGHRAHMQVLVTTISSAVHLTQWFVCEVPYIHADTVAAIVLVVIIIVVMWGPTQHWHAGP